MRISDWSSDVCSSDLPLLQTWTHRRFVGATDYERTKLDGVAAIRAVGRDSASGLYRDVRYQVAEHPWLAWTWRVDQLQQTADIRIKEREDFAAAIFMIFGRPRSEENTSELQSLMRSSYAVFCMKKKNKASKNK